MNNGRVLQKVLLIIMGFVIGVGLVTIIYTIDMTKDSYTESWECVEWEEVETEEYIHCYNRFCVTCQNLVRQESGDWLREPCFKTLEECRDFCSRYLEQKCTKEILTRSMK